MTKKQALARFKEEVLPEIREQYEKDGVDTPARREAWNIWTDSLMKDGKITPRRYDRWICPF